MLIVFYDLLEALESLEVGLTWREGGVREKLSPLVLHS